MGGSEFERREQQEPRCLTFREARVAAGQKARGKGKGVGLGKEAETTSLGH